MNMIVIVSPYNGDISANVQYALRCMRDSIYRGEAPFASHLLYPQVLNDASPQERDRGMQISYQWMAVCDTVACYTDRGWSDGMRKDLRMAITLGKKIEMRSLAPPKPHSEPLDVLELIVHARAAGLTVVYFGEEDDIPR